jgi:hypothetical protein
MTGIPSQDEDISEKLAVVSRIENNQLVYHGSNKMIKNN